MKRKFLIENKQQAANQVRLLTEQTLRAIQPIKCVGFNCGSSINPINNMIPVMQEMDMILPNLNTPINSIYDGFSFKESQNKIHNLRRN